MRELAFKTFLFTYGCSVIPCYLIDAIRCHWVKPKEYNGEWIYGITALVLPATIIMGDHIIYRPSLGLLLVMFGYCLIIAVCSTIKDKAASGLTWKEFMRSGEDSVWIADQLRTATIWLSQKLPKSEW